MTRQDLGRHAPRTGSRVLFRRTVQYTTSAHHCGKALSADVSPGGMCLRMRGTVQPGSPVLLCVDNRELKGRVAWCAPASADRRASLVGVRVYRDEPDAAATLTGFMHLGLIESGAIIELMDRRTVPAGWEPEASATPTESVARIRPWWTPRQVVAAT